MMSRFSVFPGVRFAAYAGLFFFSRISSAQGTIENPIEAESFTEIVETIADFAAQIITPVSVLVILYAGLLYMFSAGNPEKVKKARQALTWALVGLAIVLIGQGFIYIIQDVLGGGTGTD